MRVLVLPFDIASKGAATVDALNKLKGIEAKGLFVNPNNKVTKSKNAVYFKVCYFKKSPFLWIYIYFKKVATFIRLIFWADVIHWIWDSAFAGQLDLRYAALLGKPGVIEWSGSDIRYPEKAEEINPFMRGIYSRGYEYAHIESRAASDKVQQRFARMGYFPLTTPEMNLYVRKDLFPKTYITLHRLNLADFPRQTATTNTRPVVVHAPTQRIAKGSSYILEAVEELKKELDFDFVLLENMPREQALQQVKQCDIFIDQLILGSYGLASCEAMAFGKPVLCYIMPAVYNNGLPSDCPVVNTTPETIKERLRELLLSESRRKELGALGRAFAENRLDADKAATRYAEMYREVIAFKKSKTK